jgi:N,N'-diacetyllegionaminate synthase
VITSEYLPSIQIAGHSVGPGQPCFVIAEIAQAHDGSLGTCHAYIDAAAAAGANAVKFQTHIANEESSPEEPWRVKFSPQDETRFNYWKRMEFSPDQWTELARHAGERGLVFLSSPFSFRAVELLEKIGMPAWKVASGEVNNLPLIRRMAETGKPILLSSGMSSWSDLDAAADLVRGLGAPLALFQTTTAYPCPATRLGVNVLAEMSSRYSCPVGLSDHSATIYAGIAAVTLGASLLEVHLIFSRECFGPDTSSSLTSSELRQLVDGVRFVDTALAHPVDKEALASELGELRTMFGKSIVAARDLDAGTVLSEANLCLKKPATGIPAARLDSLANRTLKRAVAANQQIAEDDLV